jgi:hypothetical protein
MTGTCESCLYPSPGPGLPCERCLRIASEWFAQERLSARHLADAQAADERHGHDAPSGRQLRMEMAA